MLIPELTKTMARALERHNTSAENAKYVAEALTAAETQGLGGHGLARLQAYCGQAASGKVDGNATPTVHKVSDALIRVDAACGFAYPAFAIAIDAATEQARKSALCTALIGNSHHFGAAGFFAEQIAQTGLIAIVTGNSPKAIAPAGGSEPLFGTNPIAFAAPRAGAAPLVIDLSLSTVARGKVMVAAQKGEAIPHGWARDSEGNPTTDAQAGLDGSMEAIGGVKGAMLAMMIEILVAGLTNSNFGFEASSFFSNDGPAPKVAQMLIVIDPNAGSGNHFNQRLETLIEAMLAQPGVRLPGARRAALAAQAQAQGVDISATAKATLFELAGISQSNNERLSTRMR